MNENNRQAVKDVLRKHGYQSFSDRDLSVVRVAGEGRFDEIIAVHPGTHGRYVLWVRRGGWPRVEPIQAIMGGERGGKDSNALGFPDLDLIQLDKKLTQLVATLKRISA